jgi:hypothetical protein
MGPIASLVQDDPWLRMSKEERAGLRRGRLAKIASRAVPDHGISLRPAKLILIDPIAADIRLVDVPEKKPVAPVHRRSYQTKHRFAPNTWIGKRVLIAASKEFGMTVPQMLAYNNHARYCAARFVAIGLLLELTKMSYPAIGHVIGRRDHTTIMNGARRVTKLLESEAFRNRFDQMKMDLART